MPSMKIIKRRIASVSNTQQIMKAMNLVAASKLQKAKSRLDAIRPLFYEVKRVMDGVHCEDTMGNVFLEAREVKNVAYIVITSDRGLCGGYNANISKETLSFINNAGKNEKIITVGLKGWEYFRRRGKNILRRYMGVSETSFYEDVEQIGNQLASLYKSGEIDEAYVAYTHFASMLSHVPRIVRVLPIGYKETADKHDMMEYEPDVNTFLERAVPRYLSVIIYGSMAESAVCEQVARMMSMDSASNNAEEIIEELTLDFNRKRQGIITQEVSEIVSGANALQ